MIDMGEQLGILLVEDKDIDAALVALWLRRSSLAHNLRRAVDKETFVNELQRAPDVVLCDFHFYPGFDGIDAIYEVERLGLDVPVIVLSAVVGDERAIEIMRAGAADFLIKDRLARLESAIVRALTLRNLARDKRALLTEIGRERAWFKALVENSADVLNVIDKAGNFIYRSPASARLFGYAPAEYTGQSVFDFIHPDDVEIAVGLLRRLVETPGKVVKVYLRQKMKPGHRPFGWLRVEITAQNLIHDPLIAGIVSWTREVDWG